MALTKLIIPPDQASYAVTDGREVLSAQLDGGASRFRRDILNAASTVNVQWSVGPENFKYLRAFYKTITASGSIAFLIDLLLDEPFLTEHEAHFVPGTMRLVNQSGLQFVVSAQLEVKPIEADDDYNLLLVELYNEYGSYQEARNVMNALEQLTNVQLPESFS